jgi:hypothetical protein
MKSMNRTLGRIATILLASLLFNPPGVQARWIKDGKAISPLLGDQWYAYLASDTAGGAIITWYEARSGIPYDFDIFAQRVDRDGNILWAPEGVPICTAPGAQGDPQITADGSGGAIISWRDERSGTFHIYAQRITADGMIQWTPNGVAVTSERYGQYGPAIVPDGGGNFYIAWRDDRSGIGQIYCQKLDGNGNAQWATNGIPVCPTSYWQDRHRAVSDGSGGAIIVWEDERNSILNSFIYGQRLDGNGNKLWTASGAPIDISTGLKGHLSCIEDECGGAYIAWDSGNAAEWQDIFAQRIDSAGIILRAGTVPVCTAPQEQVAPKLVFDGPDGAIITWLDKRNGRDDIYAQRLQPNGVPAWTSNGIMIKVGPLATGFEWSAPQIVCDNAAGAIITWQEGLGTATSWDILAQRVDPDGNLLWPDTGVLVCGAIDGQYYPQMIPNGEGGAILTWRDMRQDTIGAVYAMRVTANGETVATLLQSFAARAQGSRIIIEWRLAEVDADARFTVLRSSGGGHKELVDPVLQRDGLSFTFSDETCRPGIAYRYRVDIETGGDRRILFESEAISLPALELSLAQNYPNPFNPATTIRFVLPEKASVRLAVYDCAGREIARLIDGEREAGANEVSWDGRDARGSAVGTGIYFYRLTAGKQILTKKMVLLK